jgi:hypothetical protein
MSIMCQEDVQQRLSKYMLLNQAMAMLTDNNPNNDPIACNRIDTFTSQTNYLQSRGQISQSLAAQLTQQAQSMKTVLHCS